MINEITVFMPNVIETLEDANKSFDASIALTYPVQFIQPFDSSALSVFTTDDLDLMNGVVVSYQDIIPHDNLFGIIKNYETEFKLSSSEFYRRWSEGSFLSDPKTSEWAAIYRVIYGND